MLQLDVTKASQRKILEELLGQDAVLYVHFAPPCGTASEARTIALSSSHHGPPPLRSWDKPMGLDNLTELQRQRVETANYLYEWTCKIITDLHRRGVGWSVENPAGPFMWVTTPFIKLQAAISDFLAFSFHTCMFQAERKKDTAIWTSVPQLQSALERKCDGNHSHKPWGLVGPNEFATAEECAYNVELARTWAQAVADYAIACDVVPEPQTFDEARSHHAKTTKLNQALLGLLPRGRKIPPLMCDFLQPQTFDVSEMPAVQKLAPKMRIPDSVTPFPKGSRVLRFHSNGAGGVDGHESVDGENTGLPKFAAIGIPREPWDFVAEAIKLTHPVLQRMQVPKIIEEAIDLHSFDPVGLRRRHVEFGQWVVSAAKEVQEEQKTIVNDMPVHCRRILEGKNIALFNRLIHFHSYPDVELAMQMARGFPLYGWMPASGVFQGQVRLPELHQGALKAMAKSYTQRTLAAVKGSGCADLDAALLCNYGRSFRRLHY